MSYNGIGLKSAKGSSTSGYIQKSLADNEGSINKNYLKRRNERLHKIQKLKENEARKRLLDTASGRKRDESITEHLNKREIELRVSELRDELEDAQEKDASITNEYIEEACQRLRKELTEEIAETQRISRLYRSRKERESEVTEVEKE